MSGPLAIASAASVRPTVSPTITDTAREFEALFIAQMLRAARAASLNDDPLAASGAQYADMTDTARARQLAVQTPLGVARLLKQ